MKVDIVMVLALICALILTAYTSKGIQTSKGFYRYQGEINQFDPYSLIPRQSAPLMIADWCPACRVHDVIRTLVDNCMSCDVMSVCPRNGLLYIVLNMCRVHDVIHCTIRDVIHNRIMISFIEGFLMSMME